MKQRVCCTRLRCGAYSLFYGEQDEVFQWFIVSDNAKDLLEEANQLVLYSEKLDCYIWGVTHWGTSWSMVFTTIKIDSERD